MHNISQSSGWNLEYIIDLYLETIYLLEISWRVFFYFLFFMMVAIDPTTSTIDMNMVIKSHCQLPVFH